MPTEMIQPIAGTLSQLDAQDYLESLEGLALELSRAMEAVASRALPSFEQSLMAQRSMCARLAELQSRGAPRSASAVDLSESPLEAELAGRIKDAMTTLAALNKCYTALMRHSGDTLRLFASLFRSYSGPTHHAAMATVNRRTWSCEL